MRLVWKGDQATLYCAKPGVWRTAGVVGCIVSPRQTRHGLEAGPTGCRTGHPAPGKSDRASRTGITGAKPARARPNTFSWYLGPLVHLLQGNTAYAPFSPEHPAFDSLHSSPTKCPDRITLRSGPTHLLLSLIGPRCSADRRRCQRRFWRQGVPREGREVHESGLQVRKRARLCRISPAVSLWLTSHANVPVRCFFRPIFVRSRRLYRALNTLSDSPCI
jgi:hypothetical protein